MLIPLLRGGLNLQIQVVNPDDSHFLSLGDLLVRVGVPHLAVHKHSAAVADRGFRNANLADHRLATGRNLVAGRSNR